MSIIIALIIILLIIFLVKDIRKNIITKPIYKYFKKALPPLSKTEQEAMESGTIWWDGQLFSGKPDWHLLHSYPQSQLSKEESDFIDNQVNTLLSMINEYEINKKKDLPKAVWDFLKKEKFFSFIIPKEYGGLEFSAYANSVIVAKIAIRSISTAVSVMVPNSLGPGELLSHYGTKEQKDYWLPRLVSGKELPCFGLTGLEAGSDAGSITDFGIIKKGLRDEKEIIGIELTWSKRYITLAPIATVLGLAFKLYDPEHLIGETEDIGITCALIPTSHEGVEIGNRHNPLGMSFMNGTTTGEKVFIPIDWIIGGVDFAGKGWKMLVECLSAGRGISLPALATGCCQAATYTTSAYTYIRQQFGVNINNFEGIQEVLAQIVANTYTVEATRKLTLTALDLKEKPAIITAISKYHMTELSRKTINHAMDIHAGKGIQLGNNNYLGYAHIAAPISVTVEGANILTRSLMIFGQGAIRCHPYVFEEMSAVNIADPAESIKEFDKLLTSHILFTTKNKLRAFTYALTSSYFANKPYPGEIARYYQHLTRLSSALAFTTDVCMLILGGKLKIKESLSARLGDVLSQLYMASAVLRQYESDGRQHEDLNVVKYALEQCLFEGYGALQDAIRNFPNRIIRYGLQVVIFPLGNHFKKPKDDLAHNIAKHITQPKILREKLSHLCHVNNNVNDAITEIDKTFKAKFAVEPIINNIKQAQKEGKLPKMHVNQTLIEQALKSDIITKEEFQELKHVIELSLQVIRVDEFKKL